jgi:hypothetical protein
MNNRATKSHAKSAVLAAALATGTIGFAHAADMPVKAVPAVPFFLVNDNSISFTYFPNATDPGVIARTNRYEVDLTHFDVWRYGTNLAIINFQQYGNNDPTLGNTTGTYGERESNMVLDSTLGFNEITNSKLFSNFLLKDISFEAFGFFVVADNFLAANTTQLAPGLQFALNLPGTVNLSVLAQKEFGNNSFDACGSGAATVGGSAALNLCNPATLSFSGDRNFEWTWKLALHVSEPLTFLPWPLTWGSSISVTGPKGTGISAANLAATCFGGGGVATAACLAGAETKTEVFSENRLTLDASKMFWGKQGIWDMYGGYRYWYNKFGTDHTLSGFNSPALGGDSSIESSAFVGTTYHFK